MESDACYFERRAAEEQAAADATPCEQARAAHWEMAERYACLAAAIQEATDKLGPLTELR